MPSFLSVFSVSSVDYCVFYGLLYLKLPLYINACFSISCTVIAFSDAGHASWHAPHPMQSLVFTGLGVPFLRSVMALAGQARKHFPHCSPSWKTMQFCGLKLASAILVLRFASSVNGNIAPVGQICEQRLQS